MLKKTLFIIVLFLLNGYSGFTQHVYTIGPTVHVNFGYKISMSYGFEFSYWNIKNFPFGFNLGLEKEKTAFRIYSETQTAFEFGGISLGPYLQYKEAVTSGLQSSIWGNYLPGINLRVREGKDTKVFSPGIYTKFLLSPSLKYSDRLK